MYTLIPSLLVRNPHPLPPRILSSHIPGVPGRSDRSGLARRACLPAGREAFFHCPWQTLNKMELTRELVAVARGESSVSAAVRRDDVRVTLGGEEGGGESQTGAE